MTSALASPSRRWVSTLRIGLSLLVLVALAYWGGVPSQNRAVFWLGIAAFLIMIVAVITLGWVLLKRPMAKLQLENAALPASYRQLFAWGLIFSSLNIIIGWGSAGGR